MRPPVTALALLVGLALLAAPASAQVFKKPDEALRSAFPDADQMLARDVILTSEMQKRIQELARARVDDRMVTFYEARKGGALLGYAVIQSHIVRTKRETLAIAFAPDGALKKVEIIAFLEPAEYMPPGRWLAHFEKKTAGDRLAVGQDIPPISGATLSARGIAEQARWVLHALKAAAEKGAVGR